MSRTLRTDEPALSCIFCLAVDDDGTTIKEFVVNASKTVDAGVTVGSPVSWGTQSYPYMIFGNSGSYSPANVSWGVGNQTTLPWSYTDRGAIYVACIDVVAGAGAANYIGTGGGVQGFAQMATISQKMLIATGLTTSSTSVPTGTKLSLGVQRSSDDQFDYYYGEQGSAIGTDGSVTGRTGFDYSGAIDQAGGVDGAGNFATDHGQVLLIAIFDRNLTSDEWTALHTDPIAALFEGAGPTLVQYYAGSDKTVGSWTTSTGSGSLASMIDEATPSDTDYIQSPLNPSSASCEINWNDMQAPIAGTNHTFSYRVKADGSLNGQVLLKAGDGTTIATFSHEPLPTSWTQYDQTLNGTQTSDWSTHGYPGSYLTVIAGT